MAECNRLVQIACPAFQFTELEQRRYEQAVLLTSPMFAVDRREKAPCGLEVVGPLEQYRHQDQPGSAGNPAISGICQRSQPSQAIAEIIRCLSQDDGLEEVDGFGVRPHLAICCSSGEPERPLGILCGCSDVSGLHDDERQIPMYRGLQPRVRARFGDALSQRRYSSWPAVDRCNCRCET